MGDFKNDLTRLLNLSEEHQGIYEVLEKIPLEERSNFIYDAITTKYSERVKINEIKNALYEIVELGHPRKCVMKNNNIDKKELDIIMMRIMAIAEVEIEAAKMEERRRFELEWIDDEYK